MDTLKEMNEFSMETTDTNRTIRAKEVIFSLLDKNYQHKKPSAVKTDKNILI